MEGGRRARGSSARVKKEDARRGATITLNSMYNQAILWKDHGQVEDAMPSCGTVQL